MVLSPCTPLLRVLTYYLLHTLGAVQPRGHSLRDARADRRRPPGARRLHVVSLPRQRGQSCGVPSSSTDLAVADSTDEQGSAAGPDQPVSLPMPYAFKDSARSMTPCAVRAWARSIIWPSKSTAECPSDSAL